MVAPVPPNQSRSFRLHSAARAGGLAALVMLFVQLGWRLIGAAEVPSFPELVVAAVARLTPLGIFGFMTETFGSLARNSLFVLVLIGTVATGYEAGAFAERLVASGRLGQGWAARVGSGLIISGLLFLFTGLVVLPIAYLGIFATESRSGADIITQLAVTFALFGVAWGLITTWPASSGATTSGEDSGPELSRRQAIHRAIFGAGALALLGGVGALAWRVMQPLSVTDEATSQQVADAIAARAEEQAAATPAGTPDQPAAEVAQADAQAATPEAASFDPATELAGLDADGLLTPRITSVADFYTVSKNILDPTVDADGWSLTIDGLVDQPMTYTYEELVARATTDKITTLCCISNELGGDLIGTAEWTGLPLVDLLEEARVQPDAVDLKFRCADDYEDSIPVALGHSPDVVVVVGMNGEPLTPEHGYPVRLIVPPIYGMKNVKWVERIEAVDHDFLGYWQTRGWDDVATYQIWGRIDTPTSRETLRPGPAVAAGVASAGDRGISRVELSLDDGNTWADAILEPAINAPFTWVRWIFPFEVTTETTKLMLRATDGDGMVATSQRRPPLPAGATGWPSRTLRVEPA